MNTNLITEASGSPAPAAVLLLPSSQPSAEPGQDVATVAADSGRRLILTVASDTEARRTGECGFNALLMDVLDRLEKSETCQLDREVEAVFHRICELPQIERAGLWCSFNKDSHIVTLAHLYPHYLENLSTQSPVCTPSRDEQTLGAPHFVDRSLGHWSRYRGPFSLG